MTAPAALLPANPRIPIFHCERPLPILLASPRMAASDFRHGPQWAQTCRWLRKPDRLQSVQSRHRYHWLCTTGSIPANRCFEVVEHERPIPPLTANWIGLRNFRYPTLECTWPLNDVDQDRRACSQGEHGETKVGSPPISRVLSWATIPLGPPLPTASSSLPGSDAGRAIAPLFGLAPNEVCRAVPVTRNAVGSYPGTACAVPTRLAASLARRTNPRHHFTLA